MKKIYSLLLLISFLSGARNAAAQFTGGYAVANWGTVQISCDGYVDLSNAPTSISIISGDDQSGNPGTIDFTISVPQTGLISFNWDYSTNDDAQYDYPLYLINTTEYALGTYDPFGSLTQNGSETCINVTQGDVFAFRMYTDDNVFGPAMVEITNFSFTPGIAVSPPSLTTCAGNPIALTASGGNGTYAWTGGITNSTIFQAPASNTSYTVTSMVGPCNAMSVVNVSIAPSPSLMITGYDNPICEGTSLTLTASGATTYSWTGPGAPGNNTVIVIANPLPMNILLEGTLGTCTAQVTLFVDVLQLPPLMIAGTQQLCIGGTATLQASGADTYVWNNLAQTPAISVVPVQTTTYMVTGTFTNGCTDTQTHIVSVNPLPTVSIIPNTTVFCVGETIRLTGNGALTYSWSTGATTTSISVTPTTVSTYSVLGFDSNNCTDGESFILITSPCVGIEQPDQQAISFQLYPNPAGRQFVIKSSNSIGSAQITDLNGRLLNEIQLSADSGTISVEHLPNGVYFVKAISADGNLMGCEKLVINP